MNILQFSSFTNIKNSSLLVLAVGLLAVSVSVASIFTISQTAVLAVEQDLDTYWRTTYDILVRPKNSRSPIEENHGLVEANHLSGISGGIDISQYGIIQSIPGVEVAAPIAMLGYNPEFAVGDEIGELSNPGIYLFEEHNFIDDGVNIYSGPNFTRATFYYIPSEGESFAASDMLPEIIIADLFQVQPFLAFPILIAGIDPVQEDLLIGLDLALIEGRYFADKETALQGNALGLPALINSTTYVSVTVKSDLGRVVLPQEVGSLQAIMERGGRKYLTTLPIESLATQTVASEDIYEKWVEELFTSGRGSLGSVLWDLPIGITYREIIPPFMHEGTVLEIVLPGGNSYSGFLAYREFRTPEDEETDIGKSFYLRPIGIFNIENLPKPEDINRVPLETYYPPVAILRYSENGQPVEPRILRPTINPAGYIQSPPMALTTVQAVCQLVSENCISAIRVRVGGIEALTPAAQRKIETIAGEIARLTGLDVDIMVGSSPTRVLVHVPGVGYVEEQWIQKNVTATYSTRVQTGHLLLLGGLLSIGGLFVLDLAWAEVVARRRTIALQKALGWRSSTVFAQMLGQITLVGVIASVLGVLVAWGVSRAAGWDMPSLTLVGGVLLLVVGLTMVGSAYPAWLAARVLPVVGLQRGQVFYPRRIIHLPVRGVLPFAWMGMLRRWSRTALGALTATLSSSLFVLMLAVTVDRQGAMSGTLLGEFILVRIEGYHYAIVGLGFGLAALSLANSLLASVLERRREIGVLKAVGWCTNTVLLLFLYEGALIGVLGGLAGAVLGAGVFTALYETVSLNLLWIGLAGAGLPVVVGLLAALYPALVAANVPPAEAVRYE
jgi:hypothetical protein